MLDDLEFDELMALLETVAQMPDIDFDADGNPIPFVIVEP